MKSAIPVRLADWLISLCYGVVLFFIYQEALTWLVEKDWAREDYSSSALIPLVVAYLIWEKRRQLAECPSSPSWRGGIPLLLGIAFFWLGELSGEFFTLYLSFWLVIVGLCWLHLGWDRLKIISFPLFFSLTMFPLPNFLNNQLSLKLKLLSSQLGVAMIQLSGMSAFREGNVIDVGFTRLQVVDACSGIRYMMPLVAMAILLAYYYKARLWKRVLIVLSALPVSVVTNGFRIASVGVLYPFFGQKAAEGFFHDFSGWFIFMFSLGLLLAEIWVLKRILPEPTSGGLKPAEKETPAAQRKLPASPLLARQFVTALIILSATLAAAKGIDFKEKTPISRPLAQFPAVIGEWSGVATPMEQIYRDALSFSDYTIINYRNPGGDEINFYTAYYSSQTKGGSIHSPATCLPGSGWNFEESGVVSVPLDGAAGGRTLQVSRAFMEKGGQRDLTYYWFPQRGRILTNAYQLKLYAFWDALMHRRTDGALVRVITPVRAHEQIADAESRMQSFVKQLEPVLEQYLPGKTVR